MLTEKDKNEISILIDTLNNHALTYNNNYIVLNACKEALQLAHDIIQGKKTDNYMLKITKHDGKMQGIQSLSTYKYMCDTCLKMKNIDGTICKRCYADKTLSLYKQMSATLIYNTLLLKYTTLKNRQLPFINASYFRFESFSDLQNAQHLKNLYKIARYNNNVRFALWTKNIKLLLTEKTPKNVNIIISSPFLNYPLWAFNSLYEILKKKTGTKNIKLFTVYDDEHIKRVTQNCMKKCANCLKCYQSKDKTIYINEKLK